MALPRANRLKRQQDFNRVYQRGRRYRLQHLTLRTLRQWQRDQPRPAVAEVPGKTEILSSELHSPRTTRLGISISLKVSKRAVIRNRIKRQLRACFLTLLPQIAPGWDLVVVVHPQAAECDYGQFLRELEQLLIDAEVLDGGK